MLNEGEDTSAAPEEAPGQELPPPPGTTYIQISPDERAAIDRVCCQFTLQLPVLIEFLYPCL